MPELDYPKVAAGPQWPRFSPWTHRMTNWHKKLATARERYEAQGFRGLTLHLAAKLYSSIPRKKNVEWLAHKDKIDRFFDNTYEVDTRGITQLSGLQIAGRNALFGFPHIASDPEEFSAAVASLQIKYEDFTFIDLGSGKGRALLLALPLPFHRIIGVEFALELHLIAKANVNHLRATGTNISRVSLVHADATEFDLPLEPLVIYLYNPFGDVVMKRIADRVLQSYSEHPRPIYIIYANAFLERVWVDGGFRVLKRGNVFSLLIPP